MKRAALLLGLLAPLSASAQDVIIQCSGGGQSYSVGTAQVSMPCTNGVPQTGCILADVGSCLLADTGVKILVQ